MINQKAFAPILIVVLITLAIGGYLIYQSQTKSFPAPSPSLTTAQPSPIDGIVEWKTYTNTSYRYSINYPNSWEVKNLGSIDPKTLELVAFNPGQIENEFSAVSIIVSGRTYEQELELLGPNAQPAKINYQNASRVIHGSPDGKEYIIVLFNLNSGQNALRIEAKSEHQNIFEKMLSTFKLLDQNNANEELTKYEKMIMVGYTELQRIPSPDGQYIAIKGQVPDINVITIKNKEGKIIYENIIELNRDAVFKNMERLGLKGRGQTGYSIKEWGNNTVFILQISPASGDEFETEVDIKTGKINESTFKRVK